MISSDSRRAGLTAVLGLFFAWSVVGGLLARIDSDQELIYVIVVDVLAGLALFGIVVLNGLRRAYIPTLVAALCVTIGLAYLHWSGVWARKHARDHLQGVEYQIDADVGVGNSPK